MNEQVKKICDSAIHKVKTATREELENDLIQVICTLVETIGHAEPRLLDKKTHEEKLGKLFFAMVGNIAGDYILPWKREEMKKKFAKVIDLHPLLQKYSS